MSIKKWNFLFQDSLWLFACSSLKSLDCYGSGSNDIMTIKRWIFLSFNTLHESLYTWMASIQHNSNILTTLILNLSITIMCSSYTHSSLQPIVHWSHSKTPRFQPIIKHLTKTMNNSLLTQTKSLIEVTTLIIVRLYFRIGPVET